MGYYPESVLPINPNSYKARRRVSAFILSGFIITFYYFYPWLQDYQKWARPLCVVENNYKEHLVSD